MYSESHVPRSENKSQPIKQGGITDELIQQQKMFTVTVNKRKKFVYE